MNLFKKMCIQNQQWKYNKLRTSLQEYVHEATSCAEESNSRCKRSSTYAGSCSTSPRTHTWDAVRPRIRVRDPCSQHQAPDRFGWTPRATPPAQQPRRCSGWCITYVSDIYVCITYVSYIYVCMTYVSVNVSSISWPLISRSHVPAQFSRHLSPAEISRHFSTAQFSRHFSPAHMFPPKLFPSQPINTPQCFLVFQCALSTRWIPI
jgi:hypothetical protein